MVTLRRATRADAGAVAEMMVGLYAEDPGPVGLDAARAQVQVLHLLERPRDAWLLVFDAAGGLDGYVLLVPYLSNEFGGDLVVLDELYVRPAARGRGLGGTFLEGLRRWASDVGVPRLELLVNHDNAGKLPFYARHGFRVAARHVLGCQLAEPTAAARLRGDGPLGDEPAWADAFACRDVSSAPTVPAGDDAVALARTLAADHGAHTVILYGSRARGGATAESDWDLLLLRNDGPSARDARRHQGAWVDAFVEPTARYATSVEDALRLEGGRVLLERDGAGSALLARVEALARTPPPPLDAGTAPALRAWAHRTLLRARRGERDPTDVEALHRRTVLLAELLEVGARLAGRRYRGSKAELAWLSEKAPATFAAFAGALAPGASFEALAALVTRVCGPPDEPLDD